MTVSPSLTQKYNVNQQPIENILAWVRSGEIAIPEIQRPFVWDRSGVRNLMDSLFNGYPIGYIIVWKNPDVRLKDGSLSSGKKILIDGQQRVTALRAAINGEYVVNKSYKRIRIKIAFNPQEGKFEVQTPVIRKDKVWIPDISELFVGNGNAFTAISSYLTSNPEANQQAVIQTITALYDLMKKPVGVIELAPDLDIETVTEIFIRINSKGVELSQADFAMSKIAANETYGGQDLRKAIDYFSHLAVAPEYYEYVRDNDKEFAKTDYFAKMSWLKDEKDDLYDPSYTDMLRVSFGSEFNRGKLADLVSLLSGRNFETRTFEEEIAERSFDKLKDGVMKFMNETNFKRFLMIIRSAGFIDPAMIRSSNAVNFAYLVYLTLRTNGTEAAKIESYVRRWFVLTILTGRAVGSFESQFDYDLKRMAGVDFGEYLQSIESATLTEGYWEVALPEQHMDSSVRSSPYFQVFLASQVKARDKGFLSRDITVADLIMHRGDIHHLFPRKYLANEGLKRGQYNQIANYVYMQQEINIQIGAQSPEVYFRRILDQIDGGTIGYGAINNRQELIENLRQNCIPESIFDLTIDQYQDFLVERRKLMSEKIHEYYKML
ncbi:uncharacterized protein DUF262 [Neolewinella xylanilytica]|uniref:Uncharacterized protein DUF262 n=1 Tax=Neolewinella xylanilytica TaxID=1514080 RepID=A0A2S6IA56_9BACT|nr:DUF262 domain-containing protein [Neolewinella xylanilytica]PPK88362.1 uncharacterized protein DUF262 [Neolewinella xylanilytica]